MNILMKKSGNLDISQQAFRAAAQMSSPLRVELVNGLFGTEYPLGTPTTLDGPDPGDPALNLHMAHCVVRVEAPGAAAAYHIGYAPCCRNGDGEEMYQIGQRFSHSPGGEDRVLNQRVLETHSEPGMPGELTYYFWPNEPNQRGEEAENRIAYQICNLQRLGFEKTKHMTLLLPLQVEAVSEQFEKQGVTPISVHFLRKRLGSIAEEIDSRVADGVLQKKEAESLRNAVQLCALYKIVFRFPWECRRLNRVLTEAMGLSQTGPAAMLRWFAAAIADLKEKTAPKKS